MTQITQIGNQDSGGRASSKLALMGYGPCLELWTKPADGLHCMRCIREVGVASGVPLSFRTDENTAEGLDRLVLATDRPRSWHLEQALKAYVTSQAWQIEDIRLGVAEADAGDCASDEEIEAVYASFGEPLVVDAS